MATLELNNKTMKNLLKKIKGWFSLWIWEWKFISLGLLLSAFLNIVLKMEVMFPVLMLAGVLIAFPTKDGYKYASKGWNILLAGAVMQILIILGL